MLFQLALRFPINREGCLGIWLQKHGLSKERKKSTLERERLALEKTSELFFFKKKIYLFVCLFVYLFIYLLAALGLPCCAQAFSSCGERGLLFLAVCGILIVVASLVVEHRLWTCRLQ